MDNLTINNKEKVLRELFLNPTYKFYVRELARVTKLNPNTIINITDKLEKAEIIKKEQKKNVVEIFLNLDNKNVLWRKRVFNLSQIYTSGIIDFLVKFYSPDSVSVIGSFSRGEDIEKSDIDLVVIGNKKEVTDLSRFEKVLGKKVHLLVVQKEKISEEFFNNLINGIVMYGAVRK